MAKNFGSAGSAQKFAEVAKVSAEKAQVISVKLISNENLVDYPKNHEDVQDTADLENSIHELGFTDPIEVTSYGQPDGKYMIVSGHRRRAAGVKCGIETFPCIVKSFDSDSTVYNYVLLANSQRDSAKDPLLFCKRYKMHETYLKDGKFKGNIREEVAKRLGISVQQADRYNTMNKVITPVWDMVRDEAVGMSSVMPMASHSPEEQAEILSIMQEALAEKVQLTRDTVKMIVDAYRDGKKTWAAVKAEQTATRDSGLPLNAFMNTEPSETRDPAESNRNGEVRREFDPVAANADAMDNDKAEWERQQQEREQGGEQQEQDGDNAGEEAEKEKKPKLTEEEEEAKRAKDILKCLNKLDTCISNVYTFESTEEAEETMRGIQKSFVAIVDELYSISREYKLDDTFKELLADMTKKCGEY
ncbi:putative plasmid partitioning protein (plasmid) [Oscillibacter valericigenes Sjm18-20]|nr:putative plasmid partitioning protein [Oscillibacter valericigenes Sjm18-20]